VTDGLRLEQVLVNLLTNALRHTPAGGTIRLQATSEGSRLCVEVTDTGPGIPSEHLARIWEPFYQVEAGRDRRAGTAGVGLGLTICRTIITWLGGQIDVSSRLGEGTTFTIWLPFSSRSFGEQGGRSTRGSEPLHQDGWRRS
jgi:signal transduction histidine kinase